MSEQINNRAYRKEIIKQVLSELHKGKSVDDVKELFSDAFDGVSAAEISEAEQALITEGLPVAEVQRLCDVHAAVFKGSIEEIHRPVDESEIPGHPANIIKRENRQIEQWIDTLIAPYITALPDADAVQKVKQGIQQLTKVGVHYSKKENLLFPYMEKYGITAPPKVMWGVDDEIRAQIKEVARLLNKPSPQLGEAVQALTDRVREMIFKEENILLPMLLETLTQDEWKRISDESIEIGYLLDRVPVWMPPPQQKVAVQPPEPETSGVISMPSGAMRTDELIAMLNALPFDITFVDKNDIVKYFTEGKERIFARTRSVIGRNVSNCHPPASVHIVAQIVDDFKSGKKDHEDFWINMGKQFVLIRYFAVRNEAGEYLGVLEVTQNIKPIQELTGEKRLVGG